MVALEWGLWVNVVMLLVACLFLIACVDVGFVLILLC